MDVTWNDPDTVEAKAVEHVIGTLAEDSGVLRSQHGLPSALFDGMQR